MEALTLQEVSDFAHGEWIAGDAARRVTTISSDTRTLAAGQLFLALRGENFDGHNYLAAAAQAGAAGAIVARGVARPHLPDSFALIEVADTLAAYQRIAGAYRHSLSLKVIAITGSNGKTSTKDLTAAVLGQHFRVLKTEGNLNNHIGVPRSLLRADRKHEVGIIELGMNHPGEIAPLAAMTAPNIAIITNIGCAHLEFMGTRAAIAQEKGMLAEAVSATGTVILNGLDEFTPSIVRRTRARVMCVGRPSDALHAENSEQSTDGSRFNLVHESQLVPAYLPVAGAHMITNALLAVAAGLALGMNLPQCAEGLASARLTGGRLEKKEVHGRIVLDDTYNANPDSMTAALATLVAVNGSGRRIAVLGKMGELGAAAADGYRTVGETAAREGIDFLVTVGDEAQAIAVAARENGLRGVVSVSDVTLAAQWLTENSEPGDVVLVKGSRSAGLERVIADFANRPASAAMEVAQ